MGNSLIFPVPKPTYNLNDFGDLMLMIQRDDHDKISLMKNNNSNRNSKISFRGNHVSKDNRVLYEIPTLYLHTSSKKSKYLMIYFHGNSEDIGLVFPKIITYYERFQIDILAPEYMGYGIHKYKKPNEADIINDAQVIIQYSISQNGLGYPLENIILVGISIGSAIAINIATKFPLIRGIILINSFSSIRNVGKYHAGFLFSKFIPNIFRSINIIDQIRCPILFIHGSCDKIVPLQNSEILYKKTKSKKRINIIANMGHNASCIEKILDKIQKFLVKQMKIDDYLDSEEEQQRKMMRDELRNLKNSFIIPNIDEIEPIVFPKLTTVTDSIVDADNLCLFDEKRNQQFY